MCNYVQNVVDLLRCTVCSGEAGKVSVILCNAGVIIVGDAPHSSENKLNSQTDIIIEGSCSLTVSPLCLALVIHNTSTI